MTKNCRVFKSILPRAKPSSLKIIKPLLLLLRHKCFYSLGRPIQAITPSPKSEQHSLTTETQLFHIHEPTIVRPITNLKETL